MTDEDGALARTGGRRQHRIQILTEAFERVVAVDGRSAATVAAQVVGDRVQPAPREPLDHRPPEGEPLGPAVGEHHRHPSSGPNVSAWSRVPSAEVTVSGRPPKGALSRANSSSRAILR